MKGKLTTRTSTADSPRPNFKHQENLGERIIEEQGKKFRLETLNGKEFRLPIYASTFVHWKAMSPDERVTYALNFCIHYNCDFLELPHTLLAILRETEVDIRGVLEGLGIPIETKEILNGKQFTLPLDSRGRLYWTFMTSEERIAYSIAYCIHHDCAPGSLPSKLRHALIINEEMQMVSDGIGKETEKKVTLNGVEFTIPLDSQGRISWKYFPQDKYVEYAIAHCKHNNCGISDLPFALQQILRSDPETLKKVFEGIKKTRIEVLDGIEFELPLVSDGGIALSLLSKELRIAYAIAYCKEHDCGIHSLPGGLYSLITRDTDEKRKILEGIGRQTERTEMLTGIVFVLPLTFEGNVSWKSLSSDDQVAYAIAYCKEHKCGLGKLRHGLYVTLTPEQRAHILQELSKSKETDQLGKLANVMDEF